MSTCLTMAKVNAFDVYIKYVKYTYHQANLIVPIDIPGRNDRKLCMLQIVLQVKRM